MAEAQFRSTERLATSVGQTALGLRQWKGRPIPFSWIPPTPSTAVLSCFHQAEDTECLWPNPSHPRQTHTQHHSYTSTTYTQLGRTDCLQSKTMFSNMATCWTNKAFGLQLGLLPCPWCPDQTGYRPCGDYRRLNGSTIPDPCPVPHIQDSSSRLAGQVVFSKADLVRGCHQVLVGQHDIPKTAVITPFRL